MRNGGASYFGIGEYDKIAPMCKEAVLYRENIYICDAVKSPFILGIIRPRIYLSSSLSEEEMAYIIAHESAHLKRKDHLWKPFGYLLFVSIGSILFAGLHTLCYARILSLPVMKR